MPSEFSNGVSDSVCASQGGREQASAATLQPQHAARSGHTGGQDVSSSSSNGGSDVTPPSMTAVMKDILSFALPMLATLAADPLASLVDTAFVGRLGSIPLAGTGLGVSIFNSVTRLVNAPLLAVTTSAIAAAQAAAAVAPEASDLGDSSSAPVAAAGELCSHAEGLAGQQRTAPSSDPPHAVVIPPASSCGSEPSSSPDLMLLVSDIGSVAVGPHSPANKAEGSKPHIAGDIISSPVKDSSSMCGCDLKPSGSCDAASAAWFSSSTNSSSSSGPGDSSRRTQGGSNPPDAAVFQEDRCSTPAGSASSPAGRPAAAAASGRTLGSAVSACLLLAGVFGAVQAILLTTTADATTRLWGAPATSPLHLQALRFLLVRGGLAPITILLLVLQGIYRGLRDTITPLWATVGANALNLLLLPPLIFAPLNWGVAGSAAATGASQALPVLLLMVILVVRYRLRLSLRQVSLQQVAALFAPTGLLVLRTASVMAVYAVATAVVARGGPTAAAAHQVAFQVWLAASLLADSLAVASQTLVATVTAAGQLPSARMVVRASMLLSLTLGSLLGVLLAAGSSRIPALFTADPQVLSLATHLMPLVAITQPLNALAFVLDGILYGVGGFRYASAIMVVCAAPALGLMVTGLVLHQLHPPVLLTPVTGVNPHLGPAARRLLLSGAGAVTEAGGQHRLPWAVLLQAPLCGGCWDMVQNTGTTTITGGTTFSSTTIDSSSSSSSSSSGYWSWLLSSQSPTPAMSGGTTTLGSPAAGQPFVQLLRWPAAAGIGSFMPDAPVGHFGNLARASSGGGRPEAAVTDPAASMALVWWAWSGLVALMVMRVITIYLPYACRSYPFTSLFSDLAGTEEVTSPPCGQQQDPPAAAARRPASIIRLVRAFQSVTGWRTQGRRSPTGVADSDQQQASSSTSADEEGGLRQPLLAGSSPV